jgi:hypothetical protein
MMFFVAKDDGSREHYFSETYAEHNRLKDLAAQNREVLRLRLQREADSLAMLAAMPADKTAPEVASHEPSPQPSIREPRVTESAPDTAKKKLPTADSVKKKSRT